MAHDPDFIPNRSDKVLDCWASKWLVTYSQLLTENTINSFEMTASKYELDQKHFFKYLQVRSYLMKHLEEDTS